MKKTPKHNATTASFEAAWARRFIKRVITRFPRRQPTSEDERGAQRHLVECFEAEGLGLEVETRGFEFNDSLYKNLALHFGIGSIGSIVGRRRPGLGLALHLLAGGSYLLDSTRRAFLLRRLLGFRSSLNVVATAPAVTAEPTVRLVFVSHTDAAFTGWLFEPWFTDAFASDDSPLRRGLLIATLSQLGLVGVNAARLIFGPRLGLRALGWLLSVPAGIVFFLNTQIVLKDEIVPGASDNLSGVAGNFLLARRLVPDKPEDVELVFVSTGCEEASLGGSDALAREMKGVWDPETTVILGIDGLSGGELRFFEEGEIIKQPLAPWLRNLIVSVTASHPRYAEVESFEIPVGATDVSAFLAQGFEGVCFGCVNPSRGIPDNYHCPSDNVENLDAEKIPLCVDVVEAVARSIITRFKKNG